MVHCASSGSKAPAIVSTRSRADTAGKSFFSPAVGQVLLHDHIRRLQPSGGEDSCELLSPCELGIPQLVAECHSSKQIANLLHLSAYRVETQR